MSAMATKLTIVAIVAIELPAQLLKTQEFFEAVAPGHRCPMCASMIAAMVSIIMLLHPCLTSIVHGVWFFERLAETF
jgi:hypothetical protein